MPQYNPNIFFRWKSAKKQAYSSKEEAKQLRKEKQKRKLKRTKQIKELTAVKRQKRKFDKKELMKTGLFYG